MMNIFVYLIAACVMVVVQGGVSTLPSKKHWGYKAKNCTPKIRKNLCTDCLLIEKNIDPKDGEFWDIEKVYNVEDPVCQAAIVEYNLDNPCDKMSNQCLAKWLKDPNDEVCRMRLDRMLYTNCELCCDCIPIGAKKGEYTIDVTRPNCVIHFKADNCNYYTNMEDSICKLSNKSPKALAYLEDRMKEFNCASKPLWDVCQMMEYGQNRI